MEEDEDFDYSNLGVGCTSDTPLPQREVQVYTSSAAELAVKRKSRFYDAKQSC